MTYKRFVLYSETDGVYLGSCMGFGFWSNLDSVGQDHACCFISEIQIEEYIAGWDDRGESIRPYRIVEVKTKNDLYASIPECVAAGLPAWEPDLTLQEP